MNRAIKYLLLAYIFTMPFVSAFAFTGTLSLPILFATLLFPLMFIKIVMSWGFAEKFFGIDILILLGFLFIIVFTFLIHGFGNSKALNHTIAYISTLLLFYFTIKYSLFEIPDSNYLLKKILLVLTLLTITNAVYANIEFILANFFSFNLNNYIPRPLENERSYSPVVIDLFIRSRAFASESGHFTFMMELFSPLTFYYMFFSGLCKWHPAIKTISTILIFFSFIFAASSASFIILPVAFISAALFKIKRVLSFLARNKFRSITVLFVVLSFFFVLNYFLSVFSYIFLSLTDKLDSISFDDRQERMDFFFQTFPKLNFIDKLIGTGPAGFDVLGFDDSKSILSLYYSITFEVGFIGVFFLSALFMYAFIETFKIKGKLGFFLSISVLSGIIHYYFIANFWYPWFWFIIAFALFIRARVTTE